VYLRAAGTGGELRRTAHRLLLRPGSRYGGGHGTPRPVLRLGFAHLLLALGCGPGGRGELGAQVLVLPEQPGQFGLHLVEEGIDLVLVVALSEADGRELLVPHVLGSQRHLFTST
jgi:hypothetical protein